MSAWPTLFVGATHVCLLAVLLCLPAAPAGSLPLGLLHACQTWACWTHLRAGPWWWLQAAASSTVCHVPVRAPTCTHTPQGCAPLGLCCSSSRKSKARFGATPLAGTAHHVVWLLPCAADTAQPAVCPARFCRSPELGLPSGDAGKQAGPPQPAADGPAVRRCAAAAAFDCAGDTLRACTDAGCGCTSAGVPVHT